MDRKIRECGEDGLIVDNWIRLFSRSCINNEDYGEDLSGLSVVAVDIIGGIFAIDISRFSSENNTWYFAPDTLEWECLDMQYEKFRSWVFNGNIDGFYSSMRWAEWSKDCENASFNEGILIYPFLWAKECDIETASKKVVPMREIIALNFDISLNEKVNATK